MDVDSTRCSTCVGLAQLIHCLYSDDEVSECSLLKAAIRLFILFSYILQLIDTNTNNIINKITKIRKSETHVCNLRQKMLYFNIFMFMLSRSRLTFRIRAFGIIIFSFNQFIWGVMLGHNIPLDCLLWQSFVSQISCDFFGFQQCP